MNTSVGIALALLGAILMSFGAHYQHRGVDKVERLSGTSGAEGLSLRQLTRLLARPSWLSGTILLGLAIVCQLVAMSLAPLIVVQPMGAIALVVTTLLTATTQHTKPTAVAVRSIFACVGGIFVFVAVAAYFADEPRLEHKQVITVLLLLVIVMVSLVSTWLILRRRHARGALFYIAAAGILYGFVATLAKVVITAIQTTVFDIYSAACIVGLLASTALGAYFVQTAYSSGPPDLVIAGLTVIDPIVAVLIGLLVLHEGSRVPVWGIAVFIVSGLVAGWGVITLARDHSKKTP